MRRTSRKLISLTLVLSLLAGMLSLLSLPALASPGVPMKVSYLESGRVPETDGSYYTSVQESLWVVDSNAHTILYQGGWSAGCYIPGEGFHSFTYANSSDRRWLTLSTDDQWSSPGGTVHSTSLETRAGSGDGYATGVGYKAEFSGTVKVSFDKFTPVVGDGFAIFINQNKVWPVAGGTVGPLQSMDGWMALTASHTVSYMNSAVSGVTFNLQEGDTISFLFKKGNTYTNNVAFPRIQYLSTTTVGPANSVAPGNANFPTFTGGAGSYALTSGFRAPWSIGSFPRSGATDFKPFNAINSQYCILNEGGSNEWTYGGLYLQSSKVITAPDRVTAYAYTVASGGEIAIAVDKIVAAKSGAGQDMMFCILKNNQMLWPRENGSFANYNDWFNLTAAGVDAAAATRVNAASLLEQQVVAGDVIYFCFTARSGNSSSVEQVSLSVSYCNVVSSIPTPFEASTEAAANYPTLPTVTGEGSIAGYRGRWQYEAAAAGTGAFAPLHTLKNGVLTAGEDGSGIRVLLNNARCLVLAPGAADLAVSYTVRYSGSATLTTTATGHGVYNYAVYQNANRIYYAEGATADAIAAAAPVAELRAGDVIRFVLSLPAGETVGEGLSLNPSVAYASLSDRLAIRGVSMTLASSLALNFYVAADCRLDMKTEAGLLVWRAPEEDYDTAEARATRITGGERQEDHSYRYVYTGISAKEMGDTLYVRPYYKDGADAVYGEVTEFSVLAYAQALYGRNDYLDTLLTDMLSYGAAAQEYFGYRTDSLVTAGLNPYQLAAGSSVGYICVSQKQVGAPAKSPTYSAIEGISLALGNKIAFVVRAGIDPDEADSLVLEVSQHSNMRTPATYTFTDDGFAVTEGLNAVEVGRVLYFRLRCQRDGNICYGPVITYSVESYVSSMAQSGDPRLLKLNAALLAYGYAALSYAQYAGV